MKEARFTLAVRSVGDVVTFPYGGRTYTRPQVLAVRRKLKQRGLSVVARKVPGPIARKAPLAARRKPAVASKPIRRASGPKPRKAGRWDAWRARNRKAVHDRTVFCELTHDHRGTEVDHAFGRIGEPWASSELVGVLLCMDGHRLAHRERKVREDVRRIALRRLANYLMHVEEVATLLESHLAHYPSRATYEWLIDVARRNGIQPPGWKE